MNEFAAELTNVMTPDYMEKMGLSKAPFSDIHDADNYYENDSKINIQKKIAHLLEYTNLVLFIQGANGAGKTSIIKQRILTTKQDWNICYLSAKDYTTASALIEKLATDLKLDITNSDTPALPIHDQLDMLCKTGKLPILIIDDIEQLKDQLIPVLAPFLQIQNNNRPSLRLIVSGEDIPVSLMDAIPKEQSTDASTDTDNLKYLQVLPLNETETGEYLKFRLNAAGYEKSSPFTTEIINKIYLEAKGFPKTINHLANQWLSEYSQGKVQKPALFDLKINNNKLKLSAAGLAMLVIVVLFVSFSGDSDTQRLKDKELAIPDNLEIVEPEITAEDAIETEIAKTVTAQAKSKTASTPTLTIPEEVVKSPTRAIITKNDLENESKTEKTSTKRLFESTLESEPVTETETEKKPVNSTLNEPPLIKKQIIAHNPTTNKKNTLRTAASTVNWINSQNPDYFTLQLIGGTHKSSVVNFIKKHGIKSDAHIISTTRNGNPWYSVIYKSYRLQKNAQNAADALPGDLKKTRPWIRTFGHIKRDMK